ncbi:MAG: hypothetical protein H0X24_04330 [Ktedonobacterales bacterium]|nr:hypothetical protein [Ktedonobacterales bacterium]
MSRWLGIVLGLLTVGTAIGGLLVVLWWPLMAVRVFGATADGQFVEQDVWWSYARLHPTHVFPVLGVLGAWCGVFGVGVIAASRQATWGSVVVGGTTLVLPWRMGAILRQPTAAFSVGVPPPTVLVYLLTTLIATGTALVVGVLWVRGR